MLPMRIGHSVADQQIIMNYDWSSHLQVEAKTEVELQRRIGHSLLDGDLNDSITLPLLQSAMSMLRPYLDSNLTKNKKIDTTFCMMLFQFIEKIKTEKNKLLKSYQYLQAIKKQFQSDTNSEKQLRNNLTLIFMAIYADSFVELKNYAWRFHVLPPTAQFFYMVYPVSSSHEYENEHNDPIRVLEALSFYNEAERVKYFNAIFADSHYLKSHQQLLSDKAFKKIDFVKVEQFPLMALRLHYAGINPAADVLSLWTQVLDQALLVQSDFFQFPENCQLFENIHALQIELLQLDTILQYPKRYRELAIALSIYQAVSAKWSEPKLAIDSRSAWAETFYKQLLRIVAGLGLETTKLNFSQIVKFLELPFHYQYKSVDSQFDEKDVLHHNLDQYLAAHEELAPHYLSKLIHGFMMLFKSTQPVLKPARVEKLEHFWQHPFSSFINYCMQYYDVDKFTAISPALAESTAWQHVLLQDSEGIYAKAFDLKRKYISNEAFYFTIEMFHALCEAEIQECKKRNEPIPTKIKAFMLFYHLPLSLTHGFNELNNKGRQQLLVDNGVKRTHLLCIAVGVEQFYADLTNSALLDKVIQQVNKSIESNQFNQAWLNYVYNDEYHALLLLIRPQLELLAKWVNDHLNSFERYDQHANLNKYNDDELWGSQAQIFSKLAISADDLVMTEVVDDEVQLDATPILLPPLVLDTNEVKQGHSIALSK